jgi:Peptidase A4 family
MGANEAVGEILNMRITLAILLCLGLQASEGPWWSGYVAHTESTNQFRYVQAEWTVPTLSAESKSWILCWVGLDGYYNQQVEQIGTAHETINGHQTDLAWVEFYPEPLRPVPLDLKAGDHMLAAMMCFDGVTFYYYIENLSRQNAYWSGHRPCPADLSSAEWIMEGFSLPMLPSWGKMDFTACWAVCGDHLGGIASEPWWTADGFSDITGPRQPIVSAVDPTGTAFSITRDQ